MANDVLREMNDRPDVREFIEVIIIKKRKKLEPEKVHDASQGAQLAATCEEIPV